MKKIILLAVLVIDAGFLLFGGYMYYSRVAATHMGEDLAKKAEAALAKGIAISDAEQDFPLMGQKGEDVKEKPNNDNPYNYSFLDLKEAQAGADEDYLYFKLIFFDKIPKDAPQPNGDKILGDGTKVNIVDEKGVEQLDFHMGYDFIPLGIISSNCFYSTEPTGIEWPEDARFAKTNRDCEVLVGEDYILGALPIKNNPALKTKQVLFDAQHEAESQKFDHAAVDLLGGQGKMPAVVKWIAGTKDFEVDNDFYTNGKEENWKNLK